MNGKYYTSIAIVLIFPLVPVCTHATQPAAAESASGSQATSSVPLPAESISLPGVARPSKQVTMASPLEGMLRTVHVREGQRVQAGELLATMDDRVVQAAVDLARATADRSADLRHAREELKLAESLRDRLLKLRTAQAGSDFELLEAETRLEQARAAVTSQEERQRQSQCQLELELARLEEHRIRAPFDGEIVRVHVHPGATLTRDDQLLTLARLADLEIELHVPLDFYDRLEVGQCYTLHAGAPLNRPLPAQLTYVAPLVDSATRTFRCVFTIENHDGQLPAGFSVQLDTARLHHAHIQLDTRVKQARTHDNSSAHELPISLGMSNNT